VRLTNSQEGGGFEFDPKMDLLCWLKMRRGFLLSSWAEKHLI